MDRSVLSVYPITLFFFFFFDDDDDDDDDDFVFAFLGGVPDPKKVPRFCEEAPVPSTLRRSRAFFESSVARVFGSRRSARVSGVVAVIASRTTGVAKRGGVASTDE